MFRDNIMFQDDLNIKQKAANQRLKETLLIPPLKRKVSVIKMFDRSHFNRYSVIYNYVKANVLQLLNHFFYSKLNVISASRKLIVSIICNMLFSKEITYRKQRNYRLLNYLIEISFYLKKLHFSLLYPIGVETMQVRSYGG